MNNSHYPLLVIHCSLFTGMNTYDYYSELAKPFFAPPAWLFGPVWTVLYILIAISFGYVFVTYLKRRGDHAGLLWGGTQVEGSNQGVFLQNEITGLIVLPFFLNLIFNFAFTPIQFGLRNNLLATIDILLVIGTLIWAMMVIFPIKKWVTYINIPYLLWGLFATTLQLSVTILNW